MRFETAEHLEMAEGLAVWDVTKRTRVSPMSAVVSLVRQLQCACVDYLSSRSRQP